MLFHYFCIVSQLHIHVPSIALRAGSELLILSDGDEDFPPAAMQVAHQKPQPCLEMLPLPDWSQSPREVRKGTSFSVLLVKGIQMG
uniref:Uncharacterized protein n=1 Tax=Amazona collaria TaxID=241587 RepID=A0A8B9IXI7_9PSIT